MLDDAHALLVDELACNAVPPETCQHVGSWRLRFAPDGRLRTCSVQVGPGEQDLAPSAIDERVAMAEAFYGARQAPSRFQLTDRAPDGLGRLLEARGYTVEAPVQILVAPLAGLETALAARAEREPVDARTSQHLTEEWVAAYAAFSGASAERAARRTGTFARVGPPICFASAAAFGEPISSIGIAVAERGWVGFFAFETAEHARRRGHATTVMRALTTWAAERGATSGYLQVEAGNELAAAWYRRLGFADGYRYHYRTLRSGEAPPTTC